MIRPTAVARACRAIAALLASVACGAHAQAPGAVLTLPSAGAAPPAFALVLPTQQSMFAQAAEAVRQGFFAANNAAGRKLAIQVIEIDDDPIELQIALAGAAQRGVRAVVGPLLRNGVNAVSEGLTVSVPLVALNYPDRDASAPSSMVALGLSAEAEAQHVVRLALSEFVGTRRAPGAGPRFVVVAAAGALERRIAQAYISALRAEGEPPLLIETAAESPDRLARRFDPARHEAVFLALDAREAAQMRARIPRPLLIFGTSLLNGAGGAASPEATALAHDLDGVRFVDMPWLLRADAGGGAGGPLPSAPLSPELARLYALGVDAYQVAVRWSSGETHFAADGMMGRLRLDRSAGPRVERTPAAAIFRNGAIEREGFGR